MNMHGMAGQGWTPYDRSKVQVDGYLFCFQDITGTNIFGRWSEIRDDYDENDMLLQHERLD